MTERRARPRRRDDRRRPEDGRVVVVELGPLARAAIGIAAVLAFGLVVIALFVSTRSSSQVTDLSRTVTEQSATIDEILSKKAVTVEALDEAARQQRCVNDTTVAWQLAITTTILALADEDDPAALADALGGLRPLVDELASQQARCYAPEPASSEPGE